MALPEKFADLGPQDRNINATRFQDQDWITVEVG